MLTEKQYKDILQMSKIELISLKEEDYVFDKLKISCEACIVCICQKQYMKEYSQRITIFKDKTIKLKCQRQLLRRCIERLIRENLHLKSRTNPKLNMDQLRKQLKKQMDSQLRLRVILQQQHITQLTDQLNNSKIQWNKQRQRMKADVSRLEQKTRQQEEECRRLQEKVAEMDILKVQLDQKMTEITRLTEQNQSLNRSVEQKTLHLSRIQGSLTHSDAIIQSHKLALGQRDSQKQILAMKVRSKSQELQQLTQAQSQQLLNISSLSQQKNKLNVLVESLKNQLVENHHHKRLLGFALDQAQFAVRQKSISLENLKFDVSQLKYTA